MMQSGFYLQIIKKKWRIVVFLKGTKRRMPKK